MPCLAELVADTETGEIPVKHPAESRTYFIDLDPDLEVGELIDDISDVDITSKPDDLDFSALLLVNSGTQVNVRIGGGSHPVGEERKYMITVMYDTNMTDRKVTMCELLIGTPS